MNPETKAMLVVASLCALVDYICFTYFGAPQFVGTGAYVIGQIAGAMQMIYLDYAEGK